MALQTKKTILASRITLPTIWTAPGAIAEAPLNSGAPGVCWGEPGLVEDEIGEPDPPPTVDEVGVLGEVPLIVEVIVVVDLELDQLDQVPLFVVVELELLEEVGTAPVPVVMGADVSTPVIEIGWPTPEHKLSTMLETAIRTS